MSGLVPRLVQKCSKKSQNLHGMSLIEIPFEVPILAPHLNSLNSTIPFKSSTKTHVKEWQQVKQLQHQQ